MPIQHLHFVIYMDLYQILFQKKNQKINFVSRMFLSKLFVVDFAARELVQYDKSGKDKDIRRQAGKKTDTLEGELLF